jgi:fatty-acyl-CoA synthase
MEMSPRLPDSVVSLPAALVRVAAGSNVVRFVARNGSVETFSYAELLDRARRVAGALEELAIQPGSRVAIIFRTSPEFYDAFWGTLWMSAIPVTMPPPSFGGGADYARRTIEMLQKADVSLVLTNQHLLKQVAPIVKKASPGIASKSIKDLFALAALPAAQYPLDGNETALIQFSSGTEANPKPIALTHRQILANAQAITEAIMPRTPDERAHVGACWLPLHHDMGLIGCLVTAVVQQGDMIYLSPETFVVSPARWLQTISKYRVTISPAPNFAYAMCAERVTDTDLDGLDLSCWRYALNGGDFIAAETLERFITRFKPAGFSPNAMIPAYGLAEAALAVTLSDARQCFRIDRFSPHSLANGQATLASDGIPLVCLGTALPGYELRIADARGDSLGEGVIGRVLVRGPSVFQGYFHDPKATDAVLIDGWLDTGDDGFLLNKALYVYSRRKDCVILNGRNHSPQIIEYALETALARRGISAAVGTGPEKGQRETLTIFVEHQRRASKANGQRIAERVYKAVGDATGLLPKEIIIVPAKTLPRTTSGKIRRRETVRRFCAGSLVSSDAISRFSW